MSFTGLWPRTRTVRTTIVVGRNNKTVAFRRTMNGKMDPIETDADVEGAGGAVLSDEKIDNPKHTAPSELERAHSSSDGDVMMNIAESEVMSLLAEKDDRTHAERTEAAVQKKSKKSPSICSSLAPVSHRTESKRRPSGSLSGLWWSYSAAKLQKALCQNAWKRRSKTDKFINVIVKQFVPNPFLTRPADGFIKQHMDATNEKCRFTKLQAKMVKVAKKEVSLLSIRSSSDATWYSKKTRKPEISKHKKSKWKIN